jgi:hypothetical protein
MVKRKENSPYYEMSSFGIPDSVPEDTERSYLALLENSIKNITEIWGGGTISHWPKPLRAILSGECEPEDFPDAGIEMQIVSDRARAVLQNAAPGCAEFWGVEVSRRGRPDEKYKYWLVQWLHVLDVMQWSEAKYVPSPQGSPYGPIVLEACIAQGLVPQNIKVFRIKGYELRVHVHNSVRLACIEAGLTGVQFYAVRTSA